MSARAPDWARVALGLVAVPQLVVGLWAVLAPRHFFDHFPGFGPLLVAAEPPFNAHLTSDTGTGFVATGVFAAVAAGWGLRPLVFVAGLSLSAFALPHFCYHLLNPAELLSGAENVVNVVVLGVALAVPVAVAWANRPRGAAVRN
ncbi:hypothetical protein nbrc107697_31120 [Gordonia crocea]|uniref:DUF4267 domain-containing protein n=2 Tax=Gordonia crocea TaxID=589162 RepID=A0A7I9V1P9_9ACTN|nr:hypothetical protein nbrc107697_31120 [Gordonia crocea]